MRYEIWFLKTLFLHKNLLDDSLWYWCMLMLWQFLMEAVPQRNECAWELSNCLPIPYHSHIPKIVLNNLCSVSYCFQHHLETPWFKEVGCQHIKVIICCCCVCVQSSPILCDPMDCSLPGASDGIFQARVLEWVAILSSRGSSWPRDQTCVSLISCIAGEILTSELSGRQQFNNYILQYLKWNLENILSYYSYITL